MTTLGTLKSDVQAYLVRSDSAFVNAIPTFVRTAEARLRREVVHSSMETTTTLTGTDRTATVPDDCVEIRSLTLTGDGGVGRRDLEMVTPEVIRASGQWNASGTPCYFSIEGRTIYLAPSAASTGTDFDLVYYAAYPALTDDAQTNYLLTNAYDLVLKLVLAEACDFLQDEMKRDEFFAQYASIRREFLNQDQDYISRGSANRLTGTSFKV